jgi:hypothetical protein
MTGEAFVGSVSELAVSATRLNSQFMPNTVRM